MKVLSDTFQLGAVCVGHIQGAADLTDVPGKLGEQRGVDALGVVLGEVLLLADDDALGVRHEVVVPGAGAGLVDVVLHASSCQGTAGALRCDGDRGRVGVDVFDELVLRQVGESLVQLGGADLGSGEVGAGGREEQGRVDGCLVTDGVEEPPQQGVHRVLDPGGAVLLQVLQLAHGDAAGVAETDELRGPRSAKEMHQPLLVELEGQDGRVLVLQLEFFSEGVDVDERRPVCLAWPSSHNNIRARKPLLSVTSPPGTAPEVASIRVETRGGFRR
ncbi:hypothetical protein ABZ934_27885 [Streptomyces sp. NPDC046557]|uniref:hypothetical protein n=1 Tax=Streptomyces sp. NPDC046557 TaxID=3155372 RepID=UPI0033FD47A8